MRVIDTSAWIEYFLGSATGHRLTPEMPQRSESIIPTIVQFELAKWLARETTDDVADKAIADTMKCILVDLDTKIALRGADLAREHRLAVADAIIYATALVYDAELLTCDAHFKDLPGVIYLAKAAK
jgi:predicted nucleic acid-binding protein